MRKSVLTGGALLLFLVFLLVCIGPLGAANPKIVQQGGSGTQRFVTIDFNDVDINLFIKYISELTQKNFIVDREVKGKITVISPTRISEEDAYRVFESVLEVHGFAAIPSGSVTKIVPSAAARSKNIATVREGELPSGEDKVVTQIISLKYANAEEVKNLLTPLVSKKQRPDCPRQFGHDHSHRLLFQHQPLAGNHQGRGRALGQRGDGHHSPAARLGRKRVQGLDPIVCGRSGAKRGAPGNRQGHPL
jgi:hypothetical protein